MPILCAAASFFFMFRPTFTILEKTNGRPDVHRTVKRDTFILKTSVLRSVKRNVQLTGLSYIRLCFIVSKTKKIWYFKDAHG